MRDLQLPPKRAADIRQRGHVAIHGARNVRARGTEVVWRARRLRAEVLTARVIFAAGGPMLPRAVHGLPWQRRGP